MLCHRRQKLSKWQLCAAWPTLSLNAYIGDEAILFYTGENEISVDA